MTNTNASHPKPRITVLAIGNLIRSDEDVGVHALRAMQDRLPPGVESLDGGVLGLNLLPTLRGIDWLLVLDAVNVGREPGTFVVLHADDIPAISPQKHSVHQAGFLDTLAALDLLGERPRRLVIHGVQPLTIDWGDELSASVANAMPEVVARSAALLHFWSEEAARAACSPRR